MKTNEEISTQAISIFFSLASESLQFFYHKHVKIMKILFLTFVLLIIPYTTEAITCLKSPNHATKTSKYTLALLEECEISLLTIDSNEKYEAYLIIIAISHELNLHEKEKEYLALLKNNPKYQFEWNYLNGKENFYQNNIKVAHSDFYEALSVAVIEGNKVLMAKSYNALGVIENELNNYEKALSYYSKSLDLYQQSKSTYFIGLLYTNIGTVYQLLEQYKKASNYYNLSIQTFSNKPPNDEYIQKTDKAVKHAFESLLKINLILNKKTEIKQYSNKILSLGVGQPNTNEKIPSIINQIKVYIINNNLDLAWHFLNKVNKLSMSSNKYLFNEVNFQYAQYFKSKDKIKKAIGYLALAVEYSDSSDFIKLSKYNLELSNLFEDIDPSKSLSYLQSYQVLREKHLQKKFDSSIQVIMQKIESKKAENFLNLAKLEKADILLKQKTLITKFLIITIVLIVVLVGFASLFLKKKKENIRLAEKINHHAQQLLLLNDKENTGIKGTTTIDQNYFRMLLVESMLLAVDVWESQTRTSRLELADKSKIWALSNDDGTLRTRSLDRYLSIKNIPQNPRWRNVVKTCHFVLSDSTLTGSYREKLEIKLAEIISVQQQDIS